MTQEIKDWLLAHDFEKWVGKDKFNKDFKTGNIQVDNEGVWFCGHGSCIDDQCFSLKYNTLSDIEHIMSVIHEYEIK